MRDGPIRRLVKALALVYGMANLSGTRAIWRLAGRRPFRLAGACGGCARCCEAPSIAVGRLTWYMPTLRRLFLGWHRVVNGFELVERERAGRVFVFRCTHFDPRTRRCDSYASRPLMCRDYPRVHLYAAWPELFEGCGYRALLPNGAALEAALADTALSAEEREALAHKLRLR